MFVAGVWLYHGLFNKLLHGSPRHLAIVQSIPGLESRIGEIVLMLVGAAEVAIAVWVLSDRRPVLAAAVQTIAILSMNLIELTWARAHLVWPAGLLPANLVFLGVVWYSAGWSPRLYRHRRHPVPMEAHFRDCLVLTYALPASKLAPLIPPGLEVDSYDGWGFLAVAMVQTQAMRPVGAPTAFGSDFLLAGYRVFARFRTAQGRTLRGLRILRSDTDKWRMVLGGNLLTHYNYRRCRASFRRGDSTLEVHISSPDGRADLHLVADLSNPQDAPLPRESVFRNHRDARRFAGPLPWTFDYEPQTRSIIAIKGMRTEWHPRVVPVKVTRNTFIESEPFKEARFVSAFHVSDIDYCWERGVVHPLRKEQS
jgi:hypothetical protein